MSESGRIRTYLMLAFYGLLATALGVFLGWLAIRQVQWGQLIDLLANINPFAVILAFTAMLLAGYLRGVRWKLLLKGERISALRLFFIEQAGTALDTLSMVHLLDEVVQVGILTVRDRLALAKVLATLAMQRTLEFGTIALLLAGGALLLGPMRPYWTYSLSALIGAVLALTALFIIGPALRHLWLVSRIKLTHDFGDAVVLMREDPRRTALAFALSVAQALLIGLAGWLIAFALGLDLGPVTMIVITLAVLFFGSFVPGLPMAFGTYEFAASALLALWGKSATDAVSFAIALRGVHYLPPLIVAAAFLPNEGLFSVPAFRRLLAEAGHHR